MTEILAETNKMLKTLTAQSQSSQPSSANVDPLVLIQQQLDEVRRFKTMKDVGLPSVCVRGYREALGLIAELEQVGINGRGSGTLKHYGRSKRKALFQSDGWIVNFLFFSKVACRVNGRSGGNLDLWQHLSGGPKWTVIAHMVGQHRKLEEDHRRDLHELGFVLPQPIELKTCVEGERSHADEVLNVNAAVEKFFEAEEGEVADERLDAAQWLICVVLLKVKLFVERWVEAIHKEADVLFKGVFTVTPPDVEALADNAGLEGLTFDILGPEIGRTEVTKSYGTPCPQATNAAQLAYMARHHLRESVQVKEITFEHIAGLYRLGDLGTKVISTGPVIAKLNGALPVLARLMVVMGWLIQNARASTTDGAGIEALIWSCEWLSVRRCGHCFPFYTVGCVYKELSP
ncbi:GIP, partial [Symbiodinium sp. KB8]